MLSVSIAQHSQDSGSILCPFAPPAMQIDSFLDLLISGEHPFIHVLKELPVQWKELNSGRNGVRGSAIAGGEQVTLGAGD